MGGRVVVVTVALLIVGVTACGPSPAELVRRDPCYGMTVYVDSVSGQVDSVGYVWTPGECDG